MHLSVARGPLPDPSRGVSFSGAIGSGPLRASLGGAGTDAKPTKTQHNMEAISIIDNA